MKEIEDLEVATVLSSTFKLSLIDKSFNPVPTLKF